MRHYISYREHIKKINLNKKTINKISKQISTLKKNRKIQMKTYQVFWAFPTQEASIKWIEEFVEYLTEGT